MSEITCPHCGKPVNAEGGIKFCPFCGKALVTAPAQPVSDAERDVLQKAEATEDPVRKHKLLAEAMAAYPQSLPIAEELLYLGRLYERGKGTLDFSVIKCYLLNIYLEPDVMPPAKVAAMRAELFSCPDLDRCLALAPDGDAFLARYLNRLCCQFVDLFLRGSSKYMRRIFGLGLDSRAPKLLASPTARMLFAMQHDAALTQQQRDQLMRAMYGAFETQLGGDTQWLQSEMAVLDVRLP